MKDGALEGVAHGGADDEGQENERREQCVEKQHWDDGITVKRLLLERVVKP